MAPQKKQSKFDVVVVGAGVVGCAMAASQAKEGRSVILIGM